MKTLKEINDYIEMNTDETVVIFDDYETAFIGLTTDCRAVYDYDKMIEYLIEKDGIEYIDAVEWIEYNTVRALPYYENPPIILHSVEE